MCVAGLIFVVLQSSKNEVHSEAAFQFLSVCLFPFLNSVLVAQRTVCHHLFAKSESGVVLTIVRSFVPS